MMGPERTAGTGIPGRGLVGISVGSNEGVIPSKRDQKSMGPKDGSHEVLFLFGAPEMRR
jgi:hypothetical protein